MFLAVALWAGNDNVADIVAATSRERNDVVGMPGVSALAKLLVAIIAASPLSLVLLMQLLSRV